MVKETMQTKGPEAGKEARGKEIKEELLALDTSTKQATEELRRATAAAERLSETKIPKTNATTTKEPKQPDPIKKEATPETSEEVKIENEIKELEKEIKGSSDEKKEKAPPEKVIIQEGPGEIETGSNIDVTAEKVEIEKEAEKEIGNIPLENREVEDFITEMDLDQLLPPEFEGLYKAQKLKVVRDLKQRIVDTVKSDAQTQYSEDLKNKTITGIRKVAESIKASFTKERDVKNIEKKVFEEIKNTPEGKELISRDLEMLTKKVSDRFVSVSFDGEPYVLYLSSFDIQNCTEEEREFVFNFNEAANEFTKMPYEWGQEKAVLEIGRAQIATRHKKEYEKAKAEYEKAREEILKIKTSREASGNKHEMMLEILQIDNAIQMEQLLNTHPEFEKALDDFTKSGEGKDVWKSFINTVTGKNLINRGLMAGGFGGRMLAKGAAVATGATICTALGSLAVGGLIGGIRGRIRGKETLKERQKEARHGKKDKSEEKVKMVDAAPLIGGLEKMANEVEKATTDEERAEKLGKLAVVIEYSQDQIEKGQVNFGDAKSILANQFNFVNNLNRALVLRELNVEKINKELKEKIGKAIKAKGEEVAGRISETQRKFITKQMWKGAAVGIGFAGAGYVLRYVGEYVGWWGDHDTQKVFTFHASDPKTFLTPLPPETPPAIKFFNEGIKFEHGKGGIQGILDLKKQILAQYNGDYSKAPKSIQNFMDTDATKEAIKLGLFDPSNPDGKESALIMSGSVLKFDEQGNFLFGKPDASGNIPILEKYQRRMFDSDHSAGRNVGVAQETTAPKHISEIEKAEPAPKVESASEPNPVDKARENVTRAFDDSKTEKINVADTPVEKSGLGYQTVRVGTPYEVGSKAGVGSEAYTGKETILTGNEVPIGSYYGNKVLIFDGNRYFLDPSGQYHDAFGKPYFPELSHGDNSILQNYPEFSENPFDLSGEKLMKVHEAYYENANYLFREELFNSKDSGWLVALDNQKASTAMEHTIATDGKTPTGNLGSYLEMLKNFTGLEPKSGFLGIGAETSKHYTVRALQKLVAEGKLEVFQASLRK